MWILFGIRKCVVHPVHDSISPGYQIGRALREVGDKVKNPLPHDMHREHLVRGVTVVKKGLKKNAGEPMAGEKIKYCHVT